MSVVMQKVLQPTSLSFYIVSNNNFEHLSQRGKINFIKTYILKINNQLVIDKHTKIEFFVDKNKFIHVSINNIGYPMMYGEPKLK
jgi:hypothetical protein